MGDEKYREADYLEKAYWNRDLSLSEIAQECGCVPNTVRYWMDKHDIPRKERLDACRRERCTFRTTHDGYEIASSQIDGQTRKVFIHRLIMVANCGFEALENRHVHHKNGIPWDNRPENLTALTPSEHQAIHIRENQGRDELPWRDRDRLMSVYWGRGLTIEEIADRWGCNHNTISYWLHKHELGARNRGANKPSDGQRKLEDFCTRAGKSGSGD